MNCPKCGRRTERVSNEGPRYERCNFCLLHFCVFFPNDRQHPFLNGLKFRCMALIKDHIYSVHYYAEKRV